MTNMLPRDRAEQILADHAAGKPAGAIARAYGHSPATIRAYVNGLRTPGEPAPRADDFAPFAAYCRQRLADDPHLRTPALLAELSALGLGNARSTLYHAMERHGIQAHPCPDCHPASMSGYAPLTTARLSQQAPLPVPAAPVAGEALASFLGRLATANRTTPKALLDVLPPWFGVKARWHDDRWQPSQLMPWADDAATRLAVISGSTAAAIKNALPAFGGSRSQPVRAVTACRLARQPAASASRSRFTCPPTTRSASGTASGCPGREHRSSASEAASTSSPPSARPAASSAAAP
jgi:hypothetical protein